MAVDNRRQSGLWDQNPQGIYERKTTAGPFQYYQPPSPSDRRRSFSERTGEVLPKNLTQSHDTKGAIKSATHDGLERSTSARKSNTHATRQQELGDMDDGLAQHPQMRGTQVAKARNIANAPTQPGAYSDDGYEDEASTSEPDSVPENLRRKAWSPEPTSPTLHTTALPLRHASNASEHIRRGSVPDRSPLQHLEAKLDTISKEEKRARVEQAERRAKGSLEDGAPKQSAPLRSGKGRVVSDEVRKANDGVRRDNQRRVSAGAAPLSPSSPRENGGEKFHRASNALKTGLGRNPSLTREVKSATRTEPLSPTATSTREPNNVRSQPVQDSDLGRTQSQKYRHRTRDAGFAGAAAAIAGASAIQSDDAAARGKAAYERRKSQIEPMQQPSKPVKNETDKSWGPAAAVPPSPRRQSNELERPRSKRLQKAPPTATQSRGAQEPSQETAQADSRQSMESDKRLLQGNRMGAEGGMSKAAAPTQPDIISKQEAKTAPGAGPQYQIPPQTAAARQAKDKVTFAPDVVDPETSEKGHHHVRDLLSGHHVQARGYQSNVKPLDEWRGAEVAKLSAAQLELDEAETGTRRDAWWEKRGNAAPTQTSSLDAPYEEQSMEFNPQLYLKCGPLLRFTGLRRSQKTGQGAQAWRGSVMIVTEDAESDLRKAPTLRLFAQPMDLYQKKAHVSHEDEEHHESNEEDPVSGQIKTSRIGRPIYVRPIHDIKHGVDLSRQENNNGLYSASRPAVSEPQAGVDPDSKETSNKNSQYPLRIHRRDGERLSKYQDIRAHRLHVEHGCTFWRFNLEVELGPRPARVAYRINSGPAIGFWVPARGETMNIMFHSCNGFSLSVDSAEFCGPDPLWRDVMNKHQSRPFHVMIGGGDQIYNDAAIRETTHFKEWLQIKNPEHKHHADFTAEMQDELERYYFNRYAMWFSQGLFSMANAQIPMVNIYDDHDIIDGFGSYPHHFMSSPVFTGLGAIAFKYYMLFQQQSLPTETTKEEPSWVLGASPGPYINELNRSIFVWLGEKVALLAIDCRTERMRDEILSQQSYDIIFDRCRHELVAGDTKHLIVLLGVPIAYPRLNFLENILTSRLMDPIKAIGRTGALGGFVNKFDGGVEILDDLDDHWTAKHHKEERNWFIQELQELAAEKSVRVSILGGDVHLGAVGQFYSNKKLGIPKDKDHRYMPNVVSSAIVNTPPPPMMADVLNRRNKIHHLDKETDEDMIPMFSHDVDGSKRNNRHLLPRRNYAIIREYMPGSTPPPSPPPMEDSRMTAMNDDEEEAVHEQKYPPGSIKRNMSLNRRPGSLLRRLSLRGKNPPVSFTPVEQKPTRPFSYHEGGEDINNGPAQRSNSMTAASSSQRPSLSFHRRPTNLSVKEARKAAAKGGPEADDDDDLAGHINLEHGLDISLCMEVDQHNAAGHTEPYRLLVPALWYEGPGDDNHLTLPARRPSLFQRITGGAVGRRRKESYEDSPDQYDEATQHLDRPDTAANATDTAHSNQDRNGKLEELQATAAGTSRVSQPAVQQPRSAFHQRGYDLGAPPIGASMRSNKQENAPRQSTASNTPQHGAEYDDDNSLTPSIESRDSYDVQQRQQSKAERFLGIGDNGGQDEADEDPQRSASNKRRSIWSRFSRKV